MSRTRWPLRPYGTARPAHRGVRLLTATAAAGALVLASGTAASAAVPVQAAAAPAIAPATANDNLGLNVYLFTPTQPQATIQSTLDAIAAQQVSNQFGTQRYAVYFEPGTYGSTADPLIFQLGYYTQVSGLGQNPDQVVINGSIDTYNQCLGSQTNCNATDNFWRSVSNLTIDVTGGSGCLGNTEFWAASQASPMRRVHVNGNVTLMDYCDGSPDYASGGFIADSEFTGGAVINGSQQQYLVRNTSLDNWTNGVWNQDFCGDPGAPAQSFSGTSGDAGGTSPYTTLASCPQTQEEPYLYTDSTGTLRVFVPSLQKNSTGQTWTDAGANTPGSSLSLNSFYVVTPSSTVAQINLALLFDKNLLFTPGVYNVPSTIHVLWPNTKIIGLGFPTLVPTHGNTTLDVTDVGGVNLSGLIFDAGPVNSPSLLTIGTKLGPLFDHASNPVTVDDVFFRVGGATAGSVTDAFVDNSNNSILDDIWSWRADHGNGVGWTTNTADTGATVNGNNVTAYGLAVEHYQKYETVWSGQNGWLLFFQNENPYDVPSQSAWNASATQEGYPAFYIPNSVKTFNGYGMGSYTFFNQGIDIENSMAFQSPDTAGVQFHDILTVFLTGNGGIQSVINGTGAAVNSTFAGPSDVVSYP